MHADEPHAPDVAIIGAMKCGTTTLHYYLRQHRLICAARRKELNYFSHDDQWSLGLRWYTDQFEPYRPNQLRLDSSPNYTKRQHWPMAAQRLYASNPEARLIFLVREPIDRLRSAYVHEVSAGREDRSPREALSDFDNPTVQTGRYFWQLEPYLDLFDRSQLLVIRFEDLVASPRSTLKTTLDFLDLEPLVELEDDPAAHNSSSLKTRPTELVRLLRFKQARGLLRRVHPRLAECPVPDVVFGADLSASIRAYLQPDLEMLQKTGLVEVSDWLDAT